MNFNCKLHFVHNPGLQNLMSILFFPQKFQYINFMLKIYSSLRGLRKKKNQWQHALNNSHLRSSYFWEFLIGGAVGTGRQMSSINIQTLLLKHFLFLFLEKLWQYRCLWASSFLKLEMKLKPEHALSEFRKSKRLILQAFLCLQWLHTHQAKRTELPKLFILDVLTIRNHFPQ